MQAERTISTSVGDLAVRIVGEEASRPTAVLWSSLFVDSASWERVEGELATTRMLVLISGPGHGASTDPGRLYTMEECADAAFVVLDALAMAGPVDWVGNAWGGHVGIVAATNRPSMLRSLVAIGTPVSAYTAAERRRTRLLAALYGVIGPTRFIRNAVTETLLSPKTHASDPGAVAYVDAQVKNANRHYLRNAIESISLGRQDLTHLLPRIDHPTLFITGSDDTGFTPEQATEAITLVSGGSVSIVADAAYLAPLEQPQQTARLILDFWERIPRPVNNLPREADPVVPGT